jgi:heme-degrading monooxygenase HmoA
MFVILWEFEVKPGNESRFESAYRPDGDWVRLFQRDPHFRGTQLLPDSSRPLCYFTLDFWDSEADYRRFLSANRADYGVLDRSNEGLTFRERHILSFVLDLPIAPSA